MLDDVPGGSVRLLGMLADRRPFGSVIKRSIYPFPYIYRAMATESGYTPVHKANLFSHSISNSKRNEEICEWKYKYYFVYTCIYLYLYLGTSNELCPRFLYFPHTKLIISIKSASHKSSLGNAIKHSCWWIRWCSHDINPVHVHSAQNPQKPAGFSQWLKYWNGLFQQNVTLEIRSSWKFPIHLADRHCRAVASSSFTCFIIQRDRSTWDQYVEIASWWCVLLLFNGAMHSAAAATCQSSQATKRRRPSEKKIIPSHGTAKSLPCKWSQKPRSLFNSPVCIISFAYLKISNATSARPPPPPVCNNVNILKWSFKRFNLNWIFSRFVFFLERENENCPLFVLIPFVHKGHAQGFVAFFWHSFR